MGKVKKHPLQRSSLKRIYSTNTDFSSFLFCMFSKLVTFAHNVSPVMALNLSHCFFCSSLTKKIYSEQDRWTKEHERKLSISVEMPVFRIIYSGTERYLELICKLGIFVNGNQKPSN